MTFDNEKKFEAAVIEQLQRYGWGKEVLNYPTEEELIRNWADILFKNNRQRDALNDCPLTDGEMAQILEQIASLRTPVRLNEFINGKSVSVKRDNPDDKLHFGKEVSMKIYNRREIGMGESSYQIVRQPIFKTAGRLNDRRGDLLLLINGMPVIHIELKKSGVPVSDAYNQIAKYARSGVFTGLFALVQVFVAMEPTETVYFANPGPDGKFNKAFYFHWADFNNEPYKDWQDVVKYLLNIPMAHQLIGYYTVPDKKDDTLKVMRSYQYQAAKAIADKVAEKDWSNTENLGGHIWHTTGSGKTMTSFKTAHLILSAQTADKVIFLVDRKVLGRQSFDDFTDLTGGAVEVQDTADTDILVDKLKSDDNDKRLIVTSIQKLSKVTKGAEGIRQADLEKILAKRIVIIIDEAHRSTFGEMLGNIKSTFTHALIFGFSGTPIQDVNKKKDNTTTTVFGDELHRYTLADGIRDKNVLGFDPYKVLTYKDNDLRQQVALKRANAADIFEVIRDPAKKKVYDLYMDKSKVKMAGELTATGYVKGIEDYVPVSQYERAEHKEAVVSDISDNWNITSRCGLLHAIFATSSIPEAVAYYKMFKEKTPQLRITAVFDPTIDNVDPDRTLDKEEGLAEILDDYEKVFGPSFNMAGYDSFREDVQLRLAHKKPYERVAKEKQIDLLIVVNQMLTGYDSKWINTLYLDKVLEYEHIIQAFSRTNRLFGDEKPFGLIKYYRYPHTMERNIEEAVKAYSGNIPLGLFADKLPKNLESMNNTFDEIADLFNSAGIPDFSRLPEELAEMRKFAKLFKRFNQKLEAAQIQGFSWEKKTYSFCREDGSEYFTELHFDREAYLTLLQRYKELPRVHVPIEKEPPFDIDTHIAELNTDVIDAEYIDSRFKKFIKELGKGKYDKALQDLHKTFAMLSQEEQKYAEIFIGDVQAGNAEVDPSLTFREHIAIYMHRAQNERIAKLVRRLGCDEEKLRKLIERKATAGDINQFGYFDELVASVDRKKALDFFKAVEKEKFPPYKLNMFINNYLKDFVTSGGIDRYADRSVVFYNDVVAEDVTELAAEELLK